MIDLKKFQEYKKLLESTVTNRAFRSRLMFDALFDKEFEKSITGYLKKATQNISAEELDSLLNKIREETIIYYKKSKLDINFENKLNFALRSLAYFYFLESIDEHSVLSDNIINEIKNKYPEDYLELISKIDKIYLSIDTKKRVESSKFDMNIEDDLLKKYIVLKEWQDKQHHFYDDEYGDYVKELQYQYCGDRLLDSFTLEQVTLRKRLFDNLSKKKILDIDACSLLTELYIKKFVVNYIGGKMYGLSVLNSKGIKIPFTTVIPVGVDILPSELELFNNKYEKYSVRSSADIEDGDKNSFAGMFDSYLDVSFEQIFESINKVKISIDNERLKKYIQINGLEQPHMAVIIQSFKEPTYAGVWIGNSDTSGILEWVEGNGEKLVSGSSTPNSEVWNDNKCTNALEINGIPIGSKMLEYQKLIGSNADFEWMILDNELVMLQFRPVTMKVLVDKSYSIEKNDDFTGIPAAPGIALGNGNFLNYPSDDIVEDKILLAMMTEPDWLPHLMSSKGAVTAYGGFLCHTAIVCRELGIPCVTGIGENALAELVTEDAKLEINGSNGKVKILQN